MRNIALDFNVVLMVMAGCQIKLASQGLFTHTAVFDSLPLVC